MAQKYRLGQNRKIYVDKLKILEDMFAIFLFMIIHVSVFCFLLFLVCWFGLVCCSIIPLENIRHAAEHVTLMYGFRSHNVVLYSNKCELCLHTHTLELLTRRLFKALIDDICKAFLCISD